MSVYVYNGIVVSADFKSELAKVSGEKLSEREILSLGLPKGFPYVRLENENDLDDIVKVKSLREVHLVQDIMEDDNIDTYETVVSMMEEECNEFKSREEKFDRKKIEEKPETNEKVEEFFESMFGSLSKYRHEYLFKLSENESFDTISRAYISFSKTEFNMMKSVRLLDIISFLRKTNESSYIFNKNRMATLFYSEVYERAVAQHLYITDKDKLVEVCRDYIVQNFPEFAMYAENDFHKFLEVFPDYLKNEKEIANLYFNVSMTVNMKKLDDLSYNERFFDKTCPVYFIQFMFKNNNLVIKLPTRDGNVPTAGRIRTILMLNGFVEISTDVYGFKGNEADAMKIMEDIFGKVQYGVMNERKREERSNRPENVTKEEFIKFMQDVRKKEFKNTEEGKNKKKDA